MLRVKWVLLICLISVSIAKAQQPAPIIFFTDIIAGPNSGNSDTTFSSTGGAYVTLYGNFLDNFTSVQLNGASCLTVVSNPSTWLWYERMMVKLGTSCTSGNFSITTPNGSWSGPTVATANSQTLMGWSGIDFTVSTGAIHYVSPTGNDNNAGTFQNPWQHAYKVLDTDGAGHGNVAYFMSGTFTGDNDSWGAIITPRPEYSQGTATQPNAMVGYPGATAQIGQESGTGENGIRCTDSDAWTVQNRGYWTFAKLAIRSSDNNAGPVQIAGGATPGTYDSRGWRLVALDVSSPTAGDNAVTAFQIQMASHSQLLGNWVHDVLLNTTSRLNQAMYLSSDANYIDVGWNEIYNNKGRGGLQTHSSNLCYPSCSGDQTGWVLHDLWIHDNKVHHINEEGLLVDTVDPHQGNGVRVYNNLIYDAGLDGSGDAMHHQLSGDFTQSHGIGTSPAPIWWYNNTVYAKNGEAVYGNWWPDVHSGGQTLTSRVANNILYSANSGTAYLHLENYSGSGCGNTDSFSACGTNSGTKNLFYGNGAPIFPTLFTSDLNADPLFANGPGFDFHLQQTSPAIGSGLKTITDYTGGYSVASPTYDIDGRIRPTPPSVGAYEYGTGIAVTKPNPPTNLSATVN
jgi:hypothetical protein